MAKHEKGSLLEPHFQDEDKAREYLEAARWPDGPVCPHCGLVVEACKIKFKEPDLEALKLTRKRHRKPRKGLWMCSGCRKQFSVTVKTIFEDSHIPLNKWLMAHRIRYAMTGELSEKMNGVIEADETYVGGKRRHKQTQTVKVGARPQDMIGPFGNKQAVFSVVQRGGKVHSRHIERVTADNLKAVLDDVAHKDAHLVTDTGVLWNKSTGRKHSLVNHTADEYVRYEEGITITTNTIEGYFANLKRGINGVYHHVGRKHLHRYLGEFDFRYNARETTDGERALEALKGFEGKRLTYKGSYGQN